MKFIVDKSSKWFQVISLFVFIMAFTAKKGFNIILLFMEIEIPSSRWNAIYDCQ